MGRIRSFLRRVARPAAMFGVVGVLASMLIISTPSNAHAFRDVKAQEEFIIGAKKMIAPAAQTAMAAASFTPVGFGVRLLQLGFLAYSTSDIWMPIVAGAFGQGTSNANQPAPAGTGGIDPNVELNGLTVSGFDVTVTGTTIAPGHTSDVNFGVSVHMKCNSAANGSGTAQPDTKTSPSSYYNQTLTRNFSFKTKCTYGYATGVVVGARGADPLLTAQNAGGGPKNVMRWGSYVAGTGGFDPYGETTKYKVRNECIDASGNKSTIEAESSGDMIRLPSCEAAGKGHGTGKTSITGLAPGTTVEQPLWDSPAAPSDPATPLCDAARPTGGCTLSVELDGKPCEAGNPECENWAELQKNDPNNTRLKCRFGPYTLPMAACAALEKAYFPGGAPATEENTDGNPDTQNWNDPRGNPIPARPPTSTTQTAPVPGSSGQTAPGADPQTRNCFPVGWAAFNPVEWVLKPVRCAFEPSQDLNARNAVLTDKAEGKAPISFITNLSMTGPSNGGCPSWNITIPGMGSKNVVCESSFTAAIQSVRVPLFGLVATAMVWPLLRSIWYAAIPVLRVTPSSGGK